MKAGNIYKVVFEQQYEGEFTVVGIVVSQEKRGNNTVYQFIATTGQEFTIYDSTIKKSSSTRLSTESRDALKQLYKHYQEVFKIEEKVNELERTLREKRTVLYKAKERITEITGDYTMADLSRQFEEITSYSRKEPIFSMSIEEDIEKYASPESHDFLAREYDNSIYINNEEACLKEYGITLSDSELNSLKKQLNHTILKEISDSCELGDKNWLMVSKTFTFQVKKGVSFNELVEEAKLIQSWVQKMQERGTSSVHNISNFWLR